MNYFFFVQIKILSQRNINPCYSQHTPDTVFRVIDGHGNSHHLPEPKSINIWFTPHRRLNSNSFRNVGMVVLHNISQFRGRRGIFNVESDALIFTRQVMNDGILQASAKGISEHCEFLLLPVLLNVGDKTMRGFVADSRGPISEK